MAKIKEKFNTNIEIISAIFIILFTSAFILVNFFSFILPLYFLAIGIGFILTLFFPRSGLFALVFLTIVFERFFTLSTIFIGKVEYKIYPLDIILLAIFLSIFIQLILKIVKLWHMQKSDYFLIGFIFLNLAYFFSSVYFLKTNSALAFSTFKNYAFYPLIYFAAYILIKNKEDFKRLFYFFLTGVFFISAFIFFGIINGEGLWTQFTPLSTQGVRILSFPHGLYISLAFISALIYLIFEKKNKTVFYWFLAIWGVGIVGTMMRHLWISLIFAIFVIYIFLSAKKKYAFRKLTYGYILVGIILAIFVFYVMAMTPESKIYNQIKGTLGAVAERGLSIGNTNQDESFAWRKLVWDASYKEFKKNPLLGIGTGKKVYVETRDYRDYIEVRNIHNSYLAILIQLGIAGLGFFLIFLYNNLRKLVVSLKNQENQFYKYSVLSVILVFVITLCFQPYLETNLLSIFFWIALGLSRRISINI